MRLHSNNAMVGPQRCNILYDTTQGPPLTKAPLPRLALGSADRRMRSIGGGACTGCKHENWSNTYVTLKICEKASGV